MACPACARWTRICAARERPGHSAGGRKKDGKFDNLAQQGAASFSAQAVPMALRSRPGSQARRPAPETGMAGGPTPLPQALPPAHLVCAPRQRAAADQAQPTRLQGGRQRGVGAGGGAALAGQVGACHRLHHTELCERGLAVWQHAARHAAQRQVWWGARSRQGRACGACRRVHTTRSLVATQADLSQHRPTPWNHSSQLNTVATAATAAAGICQVRPAQCERVAGARMAGPAGSSHILGVALNGGIHSEVALLRYAHRQRKVLLAHRLAPAGGQRGVAVGWAAGDEG